MSPKIQRFKEVALANLRASPVQSVILLVCFGVLVLLVFRQLPSAVQAVSADRPAGVNPDLLPAQNAAAVSAAVINAKARQTWRRLPKVNDRPLRDPFSSDWILGRGLVRDGNDTDADPRPLDSLVLQFTMTGEHRGDAAIAVISGEVLHLGETVEGYTLEAVGQRYVRLRHGKTMVTLRMR